MSTSLSPLIKVRGNIKINLCRHCKEILDNLKTAEGIDTIFCNICKNNVRFKFNLLTEEGEEVWTGSFDSEEEADAWYAKYGDFHEKRGHKLVKRYFFPKTDKTYSDD